MSQQIEGVSNLTITKLFFHATNHYACINKLSTVSQPVSYAVGPSVSKSVSQSVNQSISQSVSKSMILVKNCKFPFYLFQEKKQALRQCLTIIQLENKSPQTIKILILNSGHIVFSQTGQPTILVEKWKFRLCMFLDEWTLKYCLTIIEVENKPSQTIKCWILQSCHAEIFTQGLTQYFGQKLQISLLFAFFWGGGGGGQNKSRNKV